MLDEATSSMDEKCEAKTVNGKVRVHQMAEQKCTTSARNFLSFFQDQFCSFSDYLLASL
jgi:hypothetical protein